MRHQTPQLMLIGRKGEQKVQRKVVYGELDRLLQRSKCWEENTKKEERRRRN